MSILLTDRPVPLTLALVDAVENAAGGALPASLVQAIVAVVRDPRAGIPHTIWVSQLLEPGHRRPTIATAARAMAIIDAVRVHDYRLARGGV